MKKSGKSRTPPGKAKGARPALQSNLRSRRDLLRLAGFGSAGVILTGTGGWTALSAVRATAAEHDLGRIGQGRPAVVQVHDPTCPSCTALQRATRRALNCDEITDPLYLVASIRTQEGAAYANAHGVPHVTLLLLDGTGAVTRILTGVRSEEELKPILADHFRKA